MTHPRIGPSEYATVLHPVVSHALEEGVTAINELFF